MKPVTLHKGQKVVCTHYKDRPLCIVTDTLVDDDGYVNIWVKEVPSKKGVSEWWGPRSWFRALPTTKACKVCRTISTVHNEQLHKYDKYKKEVLTKSGLCDNNVPGCSCNQSASVGQ